MLILRQTVSPAYRKKRLSLGAVSHTDGQRLNMALTGTTPTVKGRLKMGYLDLFTSSMSTVARVSLWLTNSRPGPNSVAPLYAISNSSQTSNFSRTFNSSPKTKSSQTTKQLQYAIQNPEIIVLSDWSHFTSEELRNITLAADIDPL